jgi:hypothetical protein
MYPTVIGVDLVRGGALIHFSDGTDFFFGARFLYANRGDEENSSLPNEDDGLQDDAIGAV